MKRSRMWMSAAVYWLLYMISPIVSSAHSFPDKELISGDRRLRRRRRRS